MRKAPFVAALLLVLGSALDAAATVTLQCPPSQNAFVGLQSTVPVTATSSVPGATVTIVSTPVPQGATFTFSSAVTGPPPSSTYLLQWTPSLGQTSASVSFQASDSAGGTSFGSCTVNLTIGQAQIQYVSGIIRDFKVAHTDFGVADGDAGKQLVMSSLGADGKPVFDTGSGSTTIAGAASFSQWFNDVPGTNQSRVQSVTLSNAASIDADIFTFSSNPWYPIDNDLLGNELQAHNNYFTYEIHSYLTINQFQTLNFTSSDDLWIYIDGQLVPGWATTNMAGVHGSRDVSVNLGTVANLLSLQAGGVYRFDIFFAHRSLTHAPVLKLQVNKATLCNALSVGQPLATYGADMTGVTLLGSASIASGAGNHLRLADALGTATGAGWLPTSQVLSHGFSLKFTSQITKVGANAEGFAVVLAAAKDQGGDASNLGYAGITNSLAIEFDNFQDAIGDPFYNHISAHTNGALQNSANELTSSIGISQFDPLLPLNFANGSPHQVRIEYTPGIGGQASYGWLRVWLNDNLIPTMQAQVADSIWPSISSGGKTFVGFTASNALPSIVEIPDIYNVSLIGVPISPSLSSLLSPPATIIGGTTGSVLVQLRDACNNLIHYGGDGPQLASTLTGTATVPTTISDQSNGTYRVSYTPAPTGWGNYNLNVSYAALPIKNSPFLVHVAAPDLDGDGFPEDVDNCPGLANPTQADFDGDSLGDACDPDDDGDGVLDANDAFPFNPNESVDTDHDGIGNNADLDDDGDGQLDVDEVACGSNPLLASSLSPDFDNDFIPNCVDTDDDNDGALDVNDAFPLNPAESVDTDHDGIGNNADLDDDGDGQLDVNEVACGSDPLLATSLSPDLDHDTLPDCADPDADGDGVLNANDAFPLNAAESVDTDHDGIGNNADLDDDGDGQSDVNEVACGSDPLSAASLAADLDGDHIPNCADPDADGDGVLNANDAFPLNPAESVDTDGDGIGNNADPDDDNDGVLDANDAFPLNAAESVDTDHDGIGNNADPDDDNDGVLDANDAFSLDASESVDTDHDGIGNNADPDDDNDGVLDANDAFPLNAAESVDTDHDGIGNNADLDDDNDGVLDANDAFPLNAAESVDTDHDGTGNNADLDDDGDGVADVNDAFPLNAAESVDTDHDGIGNNADPDDDNDGVLDANDPFPLNPAESVDTDHDGIGNNADPDDDNDGVADVNDAFPLNAAESVDTDHDGIGNNADLDDDNDGQIDTDEAACGSNPLDQNSKSPDYNNNGRPDCVDPPVVTTGYYAMKQAVLNALIAARPPLSTAAKRKLDFATGRLTRGLAATLWTDANHLSRFGQRAYFLDSLALHSLMMIRPAVAGVTTPMNQLVAIDRSITSQAITEAMGANGDSRLIVRAVLERAAGDRSSSNGRLDRAVEHYRLAWMLASRAARRIPTLFMPGTEMADTIADLTALLPTATRSDNNKLARAIAEIQGALDASLWVDASHVSASRGERVFNRLSNALEALDDVSGQLEAVDDASEAITAIARLVAETAVDEAETDGTRPRTLDRAHDAIEDGDNDQAGRRNAIDYYRQAWALVN